MSNAKNTATVSATRKQRLAGETVWSVEDRFSRAMAYRISMPDGEPTEFAMVCGWDGDAEKGHWQPVRPVSDRYRPIETGKLVDMARERLDAPLVGTGEDVRIDRFGTSLSVGLRIDRPVTLKVRPFDDGHPWGRKAKSGEEVLYPVVSVRNGYAATSSVAMEIGWFRLVCSNGMKVLFGSGVNVRAIHTEHEITRVLDAVNAADFAGDGEALRRLTTARLPKDYVQKKVIDRLPARWGKELAEYAALDKNSAWAVVNGLSYLQTHVYSLDRTRQLDPLIRDVQKHALSMN